jgi:hypothetical protein
LSAYLVPGKEEDGEVVAVCLTRASLYWDLDDITEWSD